MIAPNTVIVAFLSHITARNFLIGQYFFSHQVFFSPTWPYSPYYYPLSASPWLIPGIAAAPLGVLKGRRACMATDDIAFPEDTVGKPAYHPQNKYFQTQKLYQLYST